MPTSQAWMPIVGGRYDGEQYWPASVTPGQPVYLCLSDYWRKQTEYFISGDGKAVVYRKRGKKT